MEKAEGRSRFVVSRPFANRGSQRTNFVRWGGKCAKDGAAILDGQIKSESPATTLWGTRNKRRACTHIGNMIQCLCAHYCPKHVDSVSRQVGGKQGSPRPEGRTRRLVSGGSSSGVAEFRRREGQLCPCQHCRGGPGCLQYQRKRLPAGGCRGLSASHGLYQMAWNAQAVRRNRREDGSICN